MFHMEHKEKVPRTMCGALLLTVLLDSNKRGSRNYQIGGTCENGCRNLESNVYMVRFGRIAICKDGNTVIYGLHRTVIEVNNHESRPTAYTRR